MEWVDFSLMALVERWLELRHASMLLLDLTASLQQVRGKLVFLVLSGHFYMVEFKNVYIYLNFTHMSWLSFKDRV